jgi:UDP-N-acetylmuramoylalanine--D-glutamate ligase
MPLIVPDFLRPILTRPVAVLGDGVSGRGARALLARIGAESDIYDARGVEFSPSAASRHGLAVYSPGFPPDHPWLECVRAAGGTAIGELDFASLFWAGQVVAVTGTNGKTTLVEFLVHALRAAGRDARATGNIGRAFSELAAAGDATPETIAVCEVSSFQAETLRYFRAGAVLWTNFAEDHLERHPSMQIYFEAKWALVARAGALFAGSSVKRWALAKGSGCTLYPAAGYNVQPDPFWIETEAQAADPRLANTVFSDYPQRENFLLAAAWWRAAGFDADALYAAADSFRLGRHRLARVADIDGVSFWNDSKATNFHAVEAALARFASPVLLIAGGKSKGGDIAGFTRRIAPKVKRAFLIGETSAALAAGCAAAGVDHAACATLEAAVRSATAEAGPGDNILLSPGFASFDQFRNYEDRGERFEQILGSPLEFRFQRLSDNPIPP